MAHSLEWIFKKEFLEDRDSPRYSNEQVLKKERENRFKTIWFMKDLSNILRQPPRHNSKDEEADYDIRDLKVLWTACTFFHRFYVFHSFESQARFPVAVACLFLASKVEEKPMRLSDHIFLYFKVRQNKMLKKTDQEYKDMERDVLLSERILLQTLSFDLNVSYPHQYFRQIITKDLKSWLTDSDDSKQIMRLATTLLTDSFRSTLGLQYPPQQLAYAMVFFALTINGVQPAMPANFRGISGGAVDTSTTWLDIFEREIDERILKDICFAMVDMYQTSFVPTEKPYKKDSNAMKDDISKAVSDIETLHKELRPQHYQNKESSVPSSSGATSGGSNGHSHLQLPALNVQNVGSGSACSLTIDTSAITPSTTSSSNNPQNSFSQLSSLASQASSTMNGAVSTATTVTTTLPYNYSISTAPTPPHGDASQYTYFPPAPSSMNLEQQQQGQGEAQVKEHVIHIKQKVDPSPPRIDSNEDENTSPYAYNYQNSTSDDSSNPLMNQTQNAQQQGQQYTGGVVMSAEHTMGGDETPSFEGLAPPAPPTDPRPADLPPTPNSLANTPNFAGIFAQSAGSLSGHMPPQYNMQGYHGGNNSVHSLNNGGERSVYGDTEYAQPGNYPSAKKARVGEY